MWKFLKALFKKKETQPEMSFSYDKETEVIVTKREENGMDEYDVTINTTRDLSNDDFIKIIAFVRKRIM
jgi:hypothetical protein